MDTYLIVERTRDLELIRRVAFNEKIIVDLLEDGETIKDCDFVDLMITVDEENGKTIIEIVELIKDEGCPYDSS